MIAAIVFGSTLKGLVTGVTTGWIARRWRSLPLGIAAGLAIGFALSTLAARGQPDHYWEIVLPGMLVGAIAGAVTQLYPRALPNRMPSQLSVLVLSVLVTTPCVAMTQTEIKASPLAPLDVFIGRWNVTSEGEPGKGTGEREYSRLYGSRFVQGRNRTIYKPQEKNPKGETHEDTGIFSFDRARGRIVLRQFHTEGFVNQYVSEPPAKPGVVVFTSEAIENIPKGWRARETYTIIGPDEIEEVFELAEPGKDFAFYSRARLTRVR